MRLDWLGIVESAATDSRGVVTLIGVNQNVTIAESLPAIISRTVVVYLVDEEDQVAAGSELSVSVSLAKQDGSRELARAEGVISVGEKKYPDLPGSLQLIFELAGEASEYGTYRVTCQIRGADDLSIEGEKALYVVPPRSAT